MDGNSKKRKRFWEPSPREARRSPLTSNRVHSLFQGRPETHEIARPEPPLDIQPETFPDGIRELHSCSDAILDICFIHGLRGNRETTWTAAGQFEPWPGMLLPQKLANVRVLTYGYDASVVNGSLNRLIDHAENLLIDLSADREGVGAESRPLIFVAHSLGGLVCKKALLLSRNKPEKHLQSVFHHTKGFIFMGTPHRGSWMAEWASVPARLLGLTMSTNKSLLDVLKPDDQLLESLQINFWNMIRQLRDEGRTIEITCAYEELPLTGFSGLRTLVVSKKSATQEGYSSFSIHANHWEMARFSSMEDAGFKRLLGDLRRWTKHVEKANAALNPELLQLLPECLGSLAFREMHQRSLNIERAVEGTCNWLLQHPKYATWDTRARSLLWIKGKPGSGKSTLLRHALDNATTIYKADKRVIVISFFFHGRGTDLQKSPLGFFRSVIHQLLSRVPDAFGGLLSTYQERNMTMGKYGDKWQWHKNELQDFLVSSLTKVLETHSIRMFVDALDECGEENAVALVDDFESLLQRLPPASRIHILFTCRHYPILDTDLDEGSVLCPEHENGEDISTYIQDWGSTTQIPTSVQKAIITRAAGVFMWARLVMEGAQRLWRRGLGWRAIEKGIGDIPPQLDELYTKLLSDLSNDERADSLRMLQWIYFSKTPLSLEELRWALIVDVDCSYKTLQECQDAKDYDSDMERRLKTLSRGLAETVSAPNGGVVVQFIHQSVRDFFMGNGLSTLLGYGEAVTSQKLRSLAHFHLVGTCLRYMAMEEIGLWVADERSTTKGPDTKRIESLFPFLQHATLYWSTYMARVDTQNEAQRILALLAWPSDALVELWARLRRALGHPLRWERGLSFVHIVSEYGALELLKMILEMADPMARELEKRDDLGNTPLHYAAEWRQESVARLLMEKGAEVDAKDKWHETPLHRAAKMGREGMVRLLVERGADVNAKSSDDETPLHEAAESGKEGIVRVLVELGADLSVRDSKGCTPEDIAAGEYPSWMKEEEDGRKRIAEFLAKKCLQEQ